MTCSISILAATVRKAIKRPAGAHVDPAIEDRGSREDIFVKIIDGENIPIRSGLHHDNLSILAHDEEFSIGGDGRRPVAAECPGKTPLLEDFSDRRISQSGAACITTTFPSSLTMKSFPSAATGEDQ